MSNCAQFCFVIFKHVVVNKKRTLLKIKIEDVFQCGFWGQDSGSHAFKAGSLPTKPSPQPQGAHLILPSNVKGSVYSVFWHKQVFIAQNSHQKAKAKTKTETKKAPWPRMSPEPLKASVGFLPYWYCGLGSNHDFFPCNCRNYNGRSNYNVLLTL